MCRKVLSIIVPAYNASGHIEACLRSLADQSGDDVEIILVDDGSTDDTLKVCESFKEANPRLSLGVIHKDNGGAFSARMCGIKSAHADFVVFVDSDDRLLRNSVRAILEAVKKYNPDIVIFGHTRERNRLEAPLPCKARLLDKADCLTLLCSSTKMNPLWGKAIRRSCIPTYDVGDYPAMNMGEDLFQVIDAFDRAETFVGINEKLYYYEKNPDGLTANFKGDYLESVSIAYGKLQEHAAKWEVVFGGSLYASSRGVSLQQFLSLARNAASSLSRKEAHEFFDLLSCDAGYRELSDDVAVRECAFLYRIAHRMLEDHHYDAARVYFRALTRAMNMVL